VDKQRIKKSGGQPSQIEIGFREKASGENGGEENDYGAEVAKKSEAAFLLDTEDAIERDTCARSGAMPLWGSRRIRVKQSHTEYCPSKME